MLKSNEKKKKVKIYKFIVKIKGSILLLQSLLSIYYFPIRFVQKCIPYRIKQYRTKFAFCLTKNLIVDYS